MEVLPRQIDRRLRQVDAGDDRAAAREADEIGADAAADFEQRLAAIAVEVHEPRQVMELVEPIVVEIVEELQRPDRAVGHLEVVDPRVPVALNRVDHGAPIVQCVLIRMVRDLRRLADTRFDLVVIGAGFYGAIAAWDATLRGLSVALIDQGDFGGGDLVQQPQDAARRAAIAAGDEPAADAAVHSRAPRAGARGAAPGAAACPSSSRPTRHHKRSALVMRTALMINEVVSRDRHDGLADPSLHLPAGELISRDECLRLNPVIAPEGVTGGAVWHDYQMHSTDRMTFSFVLSAAEAGAATANYVKACTGCSAKDARVAGVRVEDQLSSEPFDIRGATRC